MFALYLTPNNRYKINPTIGRNTRTKSHAQMEPALRRSMKIMINAKIKFNIKAVINMMLIIKEECKRKIIARSLPYSLIEPPKSFKINVLTNIVPCTIINGMINFKIKMYN